MRRMTLISSLFLLTQACGSQSDTSTLELINGDFAKSHQFQPTVVIYSDELGTCTATKVSPRHLITAAHCAQELTPGDAVHASNFPTRDTANLQKWFPGIVKTIQVSPDWQRYCNVSTSLMCQDPTMVGFVPPPDIATIEFTKALPTQWPSARIDTRAVAEGDDITIVGYGCETAVCDESTIVRKKFGHTKALAPRDINKYSQEVSEFSMDVFADRFLLTPGLYYERNRINLNHVSLGFGDSGGPVYRKNQYLLVGINNTSIDHQNGTSYINVHSRLADDPTRPDSTLKWLKSILPTGSFQ